jgi:glycerol-3-phosphate dehydrogenase
MTLKSLTGKEFDLVIVGGGIFGVCAAWDAALRGLSVALLEKGDFSQATSANHLKMIHGGIRYLQHLDIYRIRESCRERSALLRIAPHLAYPLPIAFPTYGHGLRGKEFLGAGFFLYDILTWDRNRGIPDPGRRISSGGFLSRQALLKRFPGLVENGLTGAAVFTDGQMYNPPRLALSFLRSAMEQGAVVGNYLGVTGFLKKESRPWGPGYRHPDRRTVRRSGKSFFNAADLGGRPLESTIDSASCPNPQAKRPDCHSAGLRSKRLVPDRQQDEDSVLSRGGRHIIMVPWNDTPIGCWHIVHRDSRTISLFRNGY